MWKFSNLNSDSMLWPPDTGEQLQNSANPYDCPLSFNSGFEPQESFFHFNSSHLPPFNSMPGSTGKDGIGQARRFLVFDHSGDQTSLVFSSVSTPFKSLNLPLPASNTAHEYEHAIGEEEMHEDSEEIDALLYSDTEYTDDEETSTGHSPCYMEEESIARSYSPVKRRKFDTSTEMDTSLIDTASSAITPHSQFLQEDNFDEIFMPSNRSRESKCEKIHRTVNLLRQIIPGGKGKDAASVLDDAIHYLKSLKLRASSSSL